MRRGVAAAVTCRLDRGGMGSRVPRTASSNQGNRHVGAGRGRESRVIRYAVLRMRAVIVALLVVCLAAGLWLAWRGSRPTDRAIEPVPAQVVPAPVQPLSEHSVTE